MGASLARTALNIAAGGQDRHYAARNRGSSTECLLSQVNARMEIFGVIEATDAGGFHAHPQQQLNPEIDGAR